MGLYLRAGHEYSETDPLRILNAANLNEHVNEAVVLPTAISSQTLKDPPARSDKILIESNGTLYHTTLQNLYDLFVEDGSVVQTSQTRHGGGSTSAAIGNVTVADGTEFFRLGITPRSSNNGILVHFSMSWGNSSTRPMHAYFAVFRLPSTQVNWVLDRAEAGSYGNMSFIWEDRPATTAPLEYSVRGGVDIAGTPMREHSGMLVLQEIKRTPE